MIYQQLIISIGLLCCCHLTPSETNNLIEPQENHGNQKDFNVLVNNLSHLREPALPSSSTISSTNHPKDCNHRSKRSTVSNLGTVRESERFTAFSLLPSAANRSVFICPEKFGYFPDKRDCTKYFVCVFGEPLHESCTGGLYFSAELQTCDWPRNVLCPNEKKNYEKSVFSTVDIGSGDDAFDYDVRQSTNSHNNNKNKRPNTVKEEPNDEDIKDRPNEINANYNKIIIRTNNSSFVRPIEHYAVDKEIPDYTLVDDQPVSTGSDKNNSNISSLPQASFIPSPPPPTPLDGGQRNSINFEAHSQPEISKAPEIDYLTDGLPLPSPKPLPRPAIIYSSAESEESVDNSDKPSIESSRPRENQDRYSENHGNKINLEFDPQAPNYAEAIPPVVDSKGGIHFSDGVGGTFGIVDQLPGLLSPSVSDHSLNVFIKPLSADSIKSGKSREARLLKDNIEPGYEYIPIITPEKSNFRSNNPFLPPNNFDNSFHSTSKSSGSRGRSASRPNEQPTGNLLAAVGAKMKSSDPEDDFRINENVTRTLSNNSKESIREHNAHKSTNPESNGQLLRKDGNEEFVLVPFNINEGRRRHRGRVRVVPKIVPKNKLHQVKMMNKNFKMLPTFIEAKTDGSVVVRAKPIGFNENSPSLSTNSVSPPSSRLPEPKNFSFDKSSSLPFRSSIPTSPPKNQPPISSSLSKETNLMSFPLPTTESNAAYNIQWNKGTIEFPDSDSNNANFIASLISNDKAIINLDNNHLTSNNGLSDDQSTSTSSDLKKDQANNERPVITSTSIGITSSTTSTTTSTTPSPISMAPFPSNTPFIGKILRTLRPQTIYSEPVKIITNTLVTGKPEKRVVTNPRPKVEDELTWPDDGFLSINKESQNSRLVNGLKDSRVLPTSRQQSTPSLPATKDSLQTTSPVTATVSNLDSTTTPLPSPSLPPSPQSPLSSFSSVPIDGTTGITLGPKTRGPTTRKSRPTNKRLVVKQRTTIAPKPPSRPANVYPTPTPYTTAVKCDPRKCLLPDCNCGGPAIPGGLKRNETPQIVLLTFDDAVNDLNWELYEEIFNSGRVNPNGCPILGTFYASHEWTDYGQVQTLYSRGHEFASHTVTHSFGEKFSKSQWHKEVNGQREILHLYGGVRLEDIRGMRAPFLQIGGNRMFEMLHEDNFTYDSSMPVFDNRPPFWPYTLDYALNHDCMISPCPTKSFPGVWEVGMVMWEDLKGGRCSMADSCSNPSDEEGVFEMLLKNFNRHYTTNKAPFGLFYHSAWFNTNHHRRGFLKFVDTILANKDVYILTNWQLIEWMRNPTPLSSIKSFQPWSCDNLSSERPGPCHHPNVCNVRYQSGTRFMKTCQPCPERYPWVGGANKHSN